MCVAPPSCSPATCRAPALCDRNQCVAPPPPPSCTSANCQGTCSNGVCKPDTCNSFLCPNGRCDSFGRCVLTQPPACSASNCVPPAVCFSGACFAPALPSPSPTPPTLFCSGLTCAAPSTCGAFGACVDPLYMAVPSPPSPCTLACTAPNACTPAAADGTSVCVLAALLPTLPPRPCTVSCVFPFACKPPAADGSAASECVLAALLPYLTAPRVAGASVVAAPLTRCAGEFALCAAASCKPLATDVTVTLSAAEAASASSPTASFPAASCTCPIYSGSALAGPGTGNMPASAAPGDDGTCAPPAGADTVWSLFAFAAAIPQAPLWSADERAPAQSCDAMPAGFANCFSMACTRVANAANGQALAECTCPINEAATGAAAAPARIAIKAAAGCNSLVVGIPLGNATAPALLAQFA